MRSARSDSQEIVACAREAGVHHDGGAAVVTPEPDRALDVRRKQVRVIQARLAVILPVSM
jgi:hypothetical protein